MNLVYIDGLLDEHIIGIQIGNKQQLLNLINQQETENIQQ
jgi:hypothetical protein